MLSITDGAQSVAQGNIIAYPTEAVYGLGCDPACDTAVQQLLQLKRRSSDKGLILIASSWQQLSSYIAEQDILPEQLQHAMQSWPGPVTWVMPAHDSISPLLTGHRDTIAVRISAHPVVRALCNACEHALVSTSANLSGEPTLLNAHDIGERFATGIAGVVEGALGEQKKPSSIFDIRTGCQLR